MRTSVSRYDVTGFYNIDPALEMVRGYPLYVKEHTDYEPPIGEVLEQCIINTLSSDADFVEWLARRPRAELVGEQDNNSTSDEETSLST